MYLLTLLTMLTKAKETKKAENTHRHQFMLWVSSVATVYSFWDLCDRIVLLNQVLLPAQSSHPSTARWYLQNAHVMTFLAQCSHSGTAKMLQAMPWGMSTVLPELGLAKGLSLMVYHKLSISHIPYHLDCMPSSLFLGYPSSKFHFHLRILYVTPQWRQSPLKKWDIMVSFKVTLALRRFCGLCPFCQEMVKCRENVEENKPFILEKKTHTEELEMQTAREQQLKSGQTNMRSLAKLQEKMAVLAEGQLKKTKFSNFEGNTTASRSQVIWKGFY